MKNKKSSRIAFVVNFFPILSETFIFSELQNLLERGVDLTIFALFRTDKYEKREDVGALGDHVEYLKPHLRWMFLIASHVAFMLSHPVAYFRTLGFACKHSRHLNVFKTIYQYLFVYKRDRRGLPKDWRQDTLLHFVIVMPFARLIIRGDYGLIHAHYADTSTSFAMLLSRLCHLPYSFTTHATDLFVNPYLLPLKIKNANFVVTCTEYNRNYIVENIKDSGNTQVFLNYHGVDTRYFKPQKAVRPERDGIVILAVGRLVSKKGYDILLKACSQLRKAGIAFECRIVGNGPLDEELKQLRDRLKLTDLVDFYGAQSPERVRHLFEQADLFVLPCRITPDGDRDGIPNVVAEAMSMQVPVISTTISGIPEIVEHGVSGLLVKPENPKELARAIMELAEDPDRRCAMGLEARKHISAIFDKQEKIGELVDLFQRQLDA